MEGLEASRVRVDGLENRVSGLVDRVEEMTTSPSTLSQGDLTGQLSQIRHDLRQLNQWAQGVEARINGEGCHVPRTESDAAAIADLRQDFRNFQANSGPSERAEGSIKSELRELQRQVEALSLRGNPPQAQSLDGPNPPPASQTQESARGVLWGLHVSPLSSCPVVEDKTAASVMNAAAAGQ